MAIPSTDLFEEFIGKTRVVERPTGPAAMFSTAVGQPTLYLEYPQTSLTLNSVLRVLSRELTDRGCPATRSVAIAVLGAIASTVEDGGNVVEHANACLSNVHACDLYQYLVLPSLCRSGYEAVFGEFQIRPFDPDKLMYWARRGGSTYPLDLHALAVGAVDLPVKREDQPDRVLGDCMWGVFRHPDDNQAQPAGLLEVHVVVAG